jgi:pimeloyl-ACP methyl ester carboxylesterase
VLTAVFNVEERRHGLVDVAASFADRGAEEGGLAVLPDTGGGEVLVIWAAHPHVNQAQFVPEWIRALSAPQTPAEYVEQIAWHYGQGGPQVFFGDIAFYSGEWDARDRVGHIDTNRCRLFMLTGEYDYSCTVELSEATAAKIPGVRFQAMQGIGHFPFAENPKRFAEYLLPILAELKG